MTSGIAERPTTRNLSELLILYVVSQFGAIPTSELLDALQKVTANAKSPFYLGDSLRDVLRSQVAYGRLEEVQEGEERRYRLTAEGDKLLQQYLTNLSSAFPNTQVLHKAG
jgi:hypothetical protein